MSAEPSRPAESLREPVVKALDLLAEMIDQGGKPVGLRELASHSQMAPSTVHRLLAALEKRSLVERDDAGRYSLGLELFRWGARLSAMFDLREIALPRLRTLGSQTNETTMLGVYNTTTQLMMYTACVESSHR
ncbi:MAG: helix-turn-helix domain-containing protein, partial [Micromonosporaceae bacterium]